MNLSSETARGSRADRKKTVKSRLAYTFSEGVRAVAQQHPQQSYTWFPD